MIPNGLRRSLRRVLQTKARTRVRLLSEACEPRMLLAASDLDMLYGTEGFASFRNDNPLFAIMALKTLPDGSVLAASENFSVTKLTPSGDLDRSFGINGTAQTGGGTHLRSMALAPDGKIVLAGSARLDSYDFAVARLNPNGTKDTTFNNGLGFANINVERSVGGTTNSKDIAYGLAVQSNGSLLLAGQTYNGSKDRTAIMRVTSSGTLDTTYGNAGKIIIDMAATPGGIGSSWSDAYVRSDDKLITVGTSSYSGGSGGPGSIIAARFNLNGTLDTTFGNNGTSIVTAGDTSAAAPTSDGGAYLLSGGSDIQIYKMTPNGALDTTWGTGGSSPAYSVTNISGDYGDLMLAPDGSLWATRGISSSTHLSHVTATGQRDPTFGTNGAITPAQGGQDPHGNAVALAPNGSVYIGASGNAPLAAPGGALVARYRGINDQPGSLTLQSGTLDVIGTTAADQVTISGDGSGVHVTLAGVQHDYATGSISRIDLRMSDGNDVVTFQPGAPIGGIDLGAGNDTITFAAGLDASQQRKVVGNIGNDTFTAASILHDFEFNAGAGTDKLTIAGSSADDSIFVLENSFTTAAGDSLTFTALETLHLDAGGGNDTIDVGLITSGSPALPKLEVFGEEGNDTFTTVNAAAKMTLNGGNGADALFASWAESTGITFDGAADDDALTFSNAPGTNNTFVQLDPGSLKGSTYSIAYSNVLDVTVNIGNNAPVTNISGAGTGVHAVVNGGTGPDQFYIGGGSLSSASGIKLNGNGGDDWVYFDDGAYIQASTYDVDNQHFFRTGMTSAVTIAGFEALQLLTSRGFSNIVNVGSTGGFLSVAMLGSGGNDIFRLAAGLSPAQWAGSLSFNGGSGNDQFEMYAPLAANVTVAGGSGSDTLTYDGIDNADDAFSVNANTIVHESAAPTVTLTHNTLETIRLRGLGGNDTADFDGSTLTGASPLQFLGGDGDDTLNVNHGAGLLGAGPEIDGGLGADVLNVLSGTYAMNTNPGATDTDWTMNVVAGSARFNATTTRITSLNVSDNASATLTAGGSRLLRLDSLDIGSTNARLDLTNNDLLVANTPKSVIESYIRTAYNSGDWNGTSGIVSSTAKNNPNANTTLGLLGGQEFNDNNGGLFNGQTVSNSDVLVKYTYFGDVDFNGGVDVSDYNLIDFGFANHFTGWANGDADWSGGATDVSDYNLIDFAFSTQSGLL